MRPALLAIDLDDTLLHTDLSISAANRLALRRAHEGGTRVVLASGRNIDSMARYAALLGLDGPDDYIIASNGAEIVETATGRVLAETLIDGALCLELTAAVEARGFPWQVYLSGKILYRGRNHWTDEDSRLTGIPNEPVDEAGLGAILGKGQRKILVPGEPPRVEELRDEMLRLYGDRVEVITSKPYFMEFLALGVDKGSALAGLASLLGLGLADCMAMGDARNDLGMLAAAGFSCAPANAVDEVKEVASWVSPLTNDEDFVADALGRWLEGR